jgi:PadR family transcriptional regulator AphA
MSLPHAVLGFLQYGPRTGYDLKRMFDASVQHFWPVQQSHIYQTLNRLVSDGYATVEVEPQLDRPNRKVYTMTQAGADELRSWLTEPRPERPIRAPFLIQLFFAGGLDDRDILHVLEAKLDEIRQLLEIFESGSVSHPTFSEDLPKREQFFWYLTLDYGIESLRFSRGWIERVIERIRAKEYRKGMAGAMTETRPS